MLTLEQNIRAVLDSCFSEAKDEIKDIAEANILRLINNTEQTEPIKEVVRCKECSRVCEWQTYNGGIHLWCNESGRDVKPDDFCSYGERPGQTEPKEKCDRPDGDCENCWRQLHCRAEPKGEK